MIQDISALNSLNDQIDEIDTDILVMLARRFEIIKCLMMARNLSEDDLSYDPAQEAMIMRRLLKKNNGVLSVPTLTKIWREIITTGQRLHKDFTVAVYMKERPNEMLELAKDYFGITGRYLSCLSVSQTIYKIDMNEADIGIVPLFEETDEAWWTALTSKEHNHLKIVARLPFVTTCEQPHKKEAFVISAVDNRETGKDRSLFAIEMASHTSRAALKTMLSEVGLNVSQVWTAPNLSHIHLFAVELDGYISISDKKILAFQEKYPKNIQMIRYIGGYAVPEVIEQGN